MGISSFSKSNTNRSSHRPGVDINVTPLVDVMLVLLIIFMVAAPMLTTGIPVSLPSAASKPISQETKHITLTLSHDHQLWMEDISLPFSEAVAKLQAMLTENPKLLVHLRADRNLAYGDVVSALETFNKAGISQVSLITDPVIEKKKNP